VPINVRLPLKAVSAGAVSVFLVLFSLSACSDVSGGMGADSGATPASTSAAVQAEPEIHQAIQGIDAAIYGYGVIGAYVSSSDQKKVERAIAALNRERFTFELAIGRHMNEIAVAYQLPNPVTDTASASALAKLLELKLIALFNEVAQNSTGLAKTAAERASTKAARRAAGWNAISASKSRP